MQKAPDSRQQIVVAALYKFAPLSGLADLKRQLSAACEQAGLMGTLLLAPEGINGTLAGRRGGIDAVLARLRETPGLADFRASLSFAEKMPFYRMKVRLKKEIVTMGVAGLDPPRGAGTYVAPADWNALISDPEVVVIDARNDYEIGIGSFEGALNPATASFGELPGWLDHQPALRKKPKVAMFCTGGIRCEKATAYLKAQGFGEVFHLEGGILNYLAEVPPETSLWRGECFVFDQRVALSHGLAAGSHDLCFGCRAPISAAQKASQHYQPGVSCPACHGNQSEEKKHRLAERQRQIERAKSRGEQHFGAAAGKKPCASR